MPDWARGRVSEEPPASGTWIVDARDFTDEKLPLAKVGAPVHCMTSRCNACTAAAQRQQGEMGGMHARVLQSLPAHTASILH